ncbi:multiple coagulation factor deficiency protein 2-like protein [Trichonephila clavipes]|nr:multiple coagulation factor deficiency protein 2-like protein [Trichonephila clavipes]
MQRNTEPWITFTQLLLTELLAEVSLVLDLASPRANLICHYFLWVTFKSKAHRNNPHSLQELQKNISATIPAVKLRSAFQNSQTRSQRFPERNSGHYEHLEDLQDRYNKDFSDKLDEVELEIFYFQLHDLNDDKQLDGLELLAAMNHVMDREYEFPKEDIENNPLVRSSLQQWWNEKFEDDANYIDEVLKEEDLDQDGFLSYFEFALGRQKEKGLL